MNDIEKLLTIKNEKKKPEKKKRNKQNNKIIINSIDKRNNEENISKNNNKINDKSNEFQKIDLLYFVQSNEYCTIFGYKFVQNNRNYIELMINDQENILVGSYKLKKGNNTISLIIKKKLVDLSYMFYECKYLKDISEIKFLDTSEVKNFSYMFYDCSSLSDLKSLANWNVSNGENFSYVL